MAKSELIQNAKFFDRLVDLVPAKYYHPSDQELVNTKYLSKDAKLKEKKSKAWKQRQGEQKQAQAKKQKRYAALQLGVF